MKLIDISPFTIFKITNQELLNLHYRCHQLWGVAEKKINSAMNTVLIKEAHNHIVEELKKRKFRHRFINELDNDVSYITESAPIHPETIIVQNSYYPDGLVEQQVYDYYQDVKGPLIRYLNGRSVSFYLSVNNQIVVKRNPKVVLTSENYNKVITGRTLSIHINRGDKPTNYIVIDIDRGPNVSDGDLLNAFDVAKNLIEKRFRGKIQKYDILSSGNGLHYIVYFHKTYNLDQLREATVETLYEQEKIPIGTSKAKKPGIVNFDMVANWTNTMHISKLSLNEDGLRVLDIRSMGISLIKAKYKIQ